MAQTIVQGFFKTPVTTKAKLYLTALTIFTAAAAAAAKPTNVLLFVVDDLGWGDFALSGLPVDRTSGGHAEYSTPHVDALAREGVVLDQYYVNELCSPTRSALLSSRYAYNTGLGHGVITNGHPVALRLNETIMANHFKNAGFATYAFGKWDIGYHTWEHTPTERGFDHYLGYYNADEDYITHSCGAAVPCKCNGIDIHRDKAPLNDTTTYSTHLYTKGIIDAINNASTHPDQPFFIYAAYQAVHGPLEAPQSYIDECIAEGVIEADRLIFCGMIKALDEGIGNITQTLRASGLENDTIIALTADNGGQNAVGGNNWPLRGNKATVFEGGLRGTGFMWGKGIENPGRLYNGIMHTVDFGPTLFAGATGNIEPFANESQKKDGLNHWGAISLAAGQNHTEPRNEVLLGLYGPDNNDASTFSTYSALRIGKWKLVVGVPEAACPAGNVSGNSCLKRATGWVYMNGSARVYNKPDPDQVCDPGPCLFDLENDPLEMKDLSGSTDPAHVQALQMLLGRLQQWNATRIPNQKFDCDPNSCPAHFNGFWMPWLNSTPPMPTPGQLPDVSSAMSKVTINAKKIHFMGWVCDNSVAANATKTCDITVQLDGKQIARITNGTIDRPELIAKHKCKDNNHGFTFEYDGEQDPTVMKGEHQFSFSIIERATGKRVELLESPQTICDGKPCTSNDDKGLITAWSPSRIFTSRLSMAWNSMYEWAGSS